MKRSRNLVPLMVERKHRRRLAAPAPRSAPPPKLAPDRSIRALRDGDREAREIEAFSRKSRAEQYREMIATWVARHRLANDPDTWTLIGEQQVARYVAERSMSHMQVIEGPDRRIVIRPNDGLWNDLKHAFLIQYSKVKKIVTDPKAPRAMALWNFIRDLSRNPGEQ